MDPDDEPEGKRAEAAVTPGGGDGPTPGQLGALPPPPEIPPPLVESRSPSPAPEVPPPLVDSRSPSPAPPVAAQGSPPPPAATQAPATPVAPAAPAPGPAAQAPPPQAAPTTTTPTPLNTREVRTAMLLRHAVPSRITLPLNSTRRGSRKCPKRLSVRLPLVLLPQFLTTRGHARTGPAESDAGAGAPSPVRRSPSRSALMQARQLHFELAQMSKCADYMGTRLIAALVGS